MTSARVVLPKRGKFENNVMNFEEEETHCVICDLSFPTQRQYVRHLSSKRHKNMEEVHTLLNVQDQHDFPGSSQTEDPILTLEDSTRFEEVSDTFDHIVAVEETNTPSPTYEQEFWSDEEACQSPQNSEDGVYGTDIT
jgi:hypothetical protein